jgi:hypothetical protein
VGPAQAGPSVFRRTAVNRKWMAAAAVAAILALIIGAAVGRSIIPSDAKRKVAKPPAPVTFTEPTAGISLRYPASWTRLRSRDPQVPLVVALSPATSLSLRVSKSELTDVTLQTLPVVRGFTDDLVGADKRAQQLSTPQELSLGGLPAVRYRYAYPTQDGKTGAHVHYFIFKRDLMIQLVFQEVPSVSLPSVEPTFNRIAATLTSRPG